MKNVTISFAMGLIGLTLLAIGCGKEEPAPEPTPAPQVNNSLQRPIDKYPKKNREECSKDMSEFTKEWQDYFEGIGKIRQAYWQLANWRSINLIAPYDQARGEVSGALNRYAAVTEKLVKNWDKFYRFHDTPDVAHRLENASNLRACAIQARELAGQLPGGQAVGSGDANGQSVTFLPQHCGVANCEGMAPVPGYGGQGYGNGYPQNYPQGNNPQGYPSGYPQGYQQGYPSGYPQGYYGR